MLRGLAIDIQLDGPLDVSVTMNSMKEYGKSRAKSPDETLLNYLLKNLIMVAFRRHSSTCSRCLKILSTSNLGVHRQEKEKVPERSSQASGLLRPSCKAAYMRIDGSDIASVVDA